MGGWVQVVNESSLILINGCLCCNASLYADFPESRGRVRSQFRGDDVGRDASRQMHWRAPRRRLASGGPNAVDASPPSRDKERRRCCGASCKGELCCCVKRCCLKAGVPPLTCCESFVDKEVCCQCGLCCCALGCKCPSTRAAVWNIVDAAPSPRLRFSA